MSLESKTGPTPTNTSNNPQPNSYKIPTLHKTSNRESNPHHRECQKVSIRTIQYTFYKHLTKVPRMQTFMRHTPTTITSNNATKYCKIPALLTNSNQENSPHIQIQPQNSNYASEPSKQPPTKPPLSQTSKAKQQHRHHARKKHQPKKKHPHIRMQDRSKK